MTLGFVGLTAAMVALGLASCERARAPASAPAPAPAPAAVPATPAPCARHRPANAKVRWICFPSGAPVDVVDERSMIVTALHLQARALVIETEPLDPAAPIANPKNPPVRICVLDKPAGFEGYVSPAAVHDEPCRRDRL